MLIVDLDCHFGDFNLKLTEQLPSGKIIGLFGSSGSGKSRLIRQLLGLDSVNQKQAHISFNGTIWQKSDTASFLNPHQRGIGYLPQSIDLFPHLTVEQNILFAKENKRNSKDDNLNLDQMLNDLDIVSIQTKYPYQLSGGQSQRVALARSIVAAEGLLILDEPLSAIGENHKPKIMHYLKSLNQNRNITILFSSHSRIEHAYLTDHLVTLHNGRVEQSDNYQTIASDINKTFAQAPETINNIDATAVDFDSDFSVNRLQTKEHSLWAGHRPIEKGTPVSLEVKAKDIAISLKPIENSSMLNCVRTILVGAKEITPHQYLLRLKFEDSYLIAFITKKSFIDLNLTNGLENRITLYASFKAVNVVSI